MLPSGNLTTTQTDYSIPDINEKEIPIVKSPSLTDNVFGFPNRQQDIYSSHRPSKDILDVSGEEEMQSKEFGDYCPTSERMENDISTDQIKIPTIPDKKPLKHKKSASCCKCCYRRPRTSKTSYELNVKKMKTKEKWQQFFRRMHLAICTIKALKEAKYNNKTKLNGEALIRIQSFYSDHQIQIPKCVILYIYYVYIYIDNHSIQYVLRDMAKYNICTSNMDRALSAL